MMLNFYAKIQIIMMRYKNLVSGMFLMKILIFDHSIKFYFGKNPYLYFEIFAKIAHSNIFVNEIKFICLVILILFQTLLLTKKAHVLSTLHFYHFNPLLCYDKYFSYDEIN
jgi:hypothetical protein